MSPQTPASSSPQAPRKRGRRPGRTHTARIDFRLPPEAREKIEQAAAVSGQSLSDFAASTLLERAESVLERQRTTILNAQQWDHFVELLMNPPEPTEALRRLMQLGEKYCWLDENGVSHTDPRFFEGLTEEDKLDPH